MTQRDGSGAWEGGGGGGGGHQGASSSRGRTASGSGQQADTSMDRVRSAAVAAASSSSSAMPAQNFYGGGSAANAGPNALAGRLLQPVQNVYSRSSNGDSRKATTESSASVNKPSSAVTGINLDDDDAIPTSPETSNAADEVMIEDVRDETEPGSPPRYELETLSAPGLPDVNMLDITGQGQLVASLLGNSRHPAFACGHGFRPWHDPIAYTRGLLEYDVNENFVCQSNPPRAEQPQQAQPQTVPAAAPVSATPVAPAGAGATPQTPQSLPQSLTQESAPGSFPTPQPPKAFSYSQAATARLPPLPAVATHAPAVAPKSAADAPAAAPVRPRLNPELLHKARPHPHAFYNVQSHAWTIVTPFPPLNLADRTIFEKPKYKAHQADTRCSGHVPGLARVADSLPSEAHHYVWMPHQVDPRYILRPSQVNVGPSYPGDPPELGGPSSLPLPDPAALQSQQDRGNRALWGFFLCSGCNQAVTVSPQDYVPSVVGRELCESFAKARAQETQDSKDIAVRDAVDYIWKVLRNILYRNELAAIPQTGTTFVKRLGTSKFGIEIFRRLGFRSEHSPAEQKQLLKPPHLNTQTILYLQRAFLEISLWSASLWLAHPGPARPPTYIPSQNATDLFRFDVTFQQRLARFFGQDRDARYTPSADAFISSGVGESAPFLVLGVVPETADRLVAFSYQSQIRTDWARMPFYFDALREISALRGNSEDLELMIAMEQSAGRMGWENIRAAIEKMGGKLQVEGKDPEFCGRLNYAPVTDEYVIQQLNLAKSRIIETDGTADDMKELRAAAESLQKVCLSDMLSVCIMTAFETEVTFTLDEAYKQCGITADTDDTMLCTAASVYLPEATPTQHKKIIAALRVIAKARNSNALRLFIEKGTIPGEMPMQEEEQKASLDRPAGLENIGNTCYLNSLLQYFFTIKELREVILDYAQYQEGEVTEELLQRKRVGGRQVTRREIERSKRFVEHLSTLFSQLIHTPTASVRPELELAYCALVSSKDEDEAATSPAAPTAGVMEGPLTQQEAGTPTLASLTPSTLDSDPAGASSSLAIETTEVGLAAAQAPALAPAPAVGPPAEALASPMSSGSPSVLGKRNSEHLESSGDVDMESQSHLPRQRSMTAPASELAEGEKQDADIVMDDAEAGAVTPSTTLVSQHAEPRSTDEESALAIEAASGVAVTLDIATTARTAEEGKLGPPALPPRPEQRRKSTAASAAVKSNMMFGKQNDVSEAMDNVIFQIEVALDDAKLPKSEEPVASGSTPRSFIQSLFYGTSRQTLDFETPTTGAQRVKEESFSYLLVDVAQEGTDLYDGLDTAFQTSTVEVEGKQAVRRDALTELPPILQIQLQRVQFDRKTAKVFKSNAYMPFPETLRMNRYLAHDTDDAVAVERHQTSADLRRRIAKARARLVDLEQVDEDKQSIPQILRDTEAALQQAAASDFADPESASFSNTLQSILRPDNGDADVLEELLQHAAASDQDIVSTKGEIETCRAELERLWAEDDGLGAEYELASVFIHLGAAGFGHYYLHQRALPSQPERWLKFNDSTVTDIPRSEVFANTTGQTANPYWLSYVRKADISKHVDAVCRAF